MTRQGKKAGLLRQKNSWKLRVSRKKYCLTKKKISQQYNFPWLKQLLKSSTQKLIAVKMKMSKGCVPSISYNRDQTIQLKPMPKRKRKVKTKKRDPTWQQSGEFVPEIFRFHLLFFSLPFTAASVKSKVISLLRKISIALQSEHNWIKIVKI